MVLRPLRQLAPSPEAVALYDEWLSELAVRLADPATDRNELCVEFLRDLYYPQLDGAEESRLPRTTRVALRHLDPRCVTLEPEYYHDIDEELYYPRKPLIWLWQMFDRSPLGGDVHLGVLFRRTLAPYVLRKVGRNFKCFHFVEVSFGYNLTVGDDVVVHRNVLLDDRGGIRIGNQVSIADFATVFSHTHSVDDIVDVTNIETVLEDNVRVTYGATVLAGVHVGVQGMIGAKALATKNVLPYHVNVGIPARPAKIKSIAPAELREGG